MPIGESIREGDRRFAAATYALCGALANAGARQAVPAPVCYWHLTGEFGLATLDRAWVALLDGKTTLMTNCLAKGYNDARCFPEEGGDYHQFVSRQFQCVGLSQTTQTVRVREAVKDSDVVAFRSAHVMNTACTHSSVSLQRPVQRARIPCHHSRL